VFLICARPGYQIDGCSCLYQSNQLLGERERTSEAEHARNSVHKLYMRDQFVQFRGSPSVEHH